MKVKERERARELRKEGKSVGGIAAVLSVSRGSVSRWVRDIVLTFEQIERLNKNQVPTQFDRYRIGKINRERARMKRRRYQQEGRVLLKKSDEMFIAGIMLFWAEGNKCKNSVVFSNSEPAMMSFFIKFLRRYFNIDEKRLRFSFQWYSNNDITKEDVADYWSKLLDISKSQMNKCYIDYRPVKNMGKKKGKCPFGVCRLVLSDTRIVQMFYGAIQEYVGFESENWLF